MAKHPGYPFVPKSTTHLRPGDFWGVPLTDGRHAAGRVLAVEAEPDADEYLAINGTTSFLAALMDWSGQTPPTAEDLAGSSVIAQGTAHVRAILHSGGEVLGHRPLELDGVTGLVRVSHRSGGEVLLYEGARVLREATKEEAAALPSLGGWAVNTISALAERHFVKGEPLVP